MTTRTQIVSSAAQRIYKEVAAKLPEWIESMNPASRKAYLKQHPDSKYAAQLQQAQGSGDKVADKHNETIKQAAAEAKAVRAQIKSLKEQLPDPIETRADKAKATRINKKIADLMTNLQEHKATALKAKTLLEKRQAKKAEPTPEPTPKEDAPSGKANYSKMPTPKLAAEEKRLKSLLFHHDTTMPVLRRTKVALTKVREELESRKTKDPTKEDAPKAENVAPVDPKAPVGDKPSAAANKIAKSIGFPASSSTSSGEHRYSGSKGAGEKVLKAIWAKSAENGFVSAGKTSQYAPDGSSSSWQSRSVHPDGWVLTTAGSSRGGSAATMKYVGPEEAKKLLDSSKPAPKSETPVGGDDAKKSETAPTTTAQDEVKEAESKYEAAKKQVEAYRRILHSGSGGANASDDLTKAVEKVNELHKILSDKQSALKREEVETDAELIKKSSAAKEKYVPDAIAVSDARGEIADIKAELKEAQKRLSTARGQGDAQNTRRGISEITYRLKAAQEKLAKLLKP